MRAMKGIADQVLTALLPYLCIPLWSISVFHRLLRFREPTKRVLLVTRNAIAADHMVYVHELLEGHVEIEEYVTTDRVPDRGFSRIDAAQIVGPPSIHILTALICHWDLVIFTNHPYGFGVCFPPWIKKLYINHGLHTGKINTDKAEDGVYGRSKVIRPFGKPFYHCMFSASSEERAFAIRQTPELRGRIAVVGFLRADWFMEYAKENGAQIRKDLGNTHQDRIVHIISTWGDHSLYGTRGQWLVEQVGKLAEKYTFLVSIHPRMDDIDSRIGESRDTILRRFEQAGAIVDRNLDWKVCVVAADATLSDHSSLCLYHVLLGHPVLLSDVHSNQYMQGATFDILNQSSRRLSEFPSLKDALEELFRAASTQSNRVLLDHMLEQRGSAAERYRQEIGSLLELSLTHR